MGHDVRRVPAHEERVVLGSRGARVDRREHARHGPEQLHGRVDEVAVQVEQDAAALARARVLPPAVLGHRPPPLPAHLVAEGRAHQPVGDHAGDGRVLGVEAPVVEHGEGDTGRLGVPHDLGSAVGVDREGLVDEARDAGVDDRPHLVGVRAARRGEHDQLDPRDREEVVQPGHDPGARELGARRGPTLGVARRDGDDLAAGLVQQGGVDGLPGRPEPGECDARHARQPRTRSWRPRAPRPRPARRVPAGRPRGDAATRSAGRRRTPRPARAASARRRCRGARRRRR